MVNSTMKDRAMNITEEEYTTLTPMEISQKHNVSLAYVYTLRKLKGFSSNKEFKRNNVLASNKELSELTLIEIGNKYSVSTSIVREWRAKKGIKPLSKGKAYKDKIIDNLSAINKLKMLNRTTRLVGALPYLRDIELARAFNLSRERVRQIRNTYSVPCVCHDDLISDPSEALT